MVFRYCQPRIFTGDKIMKNYLFFIMLAFIAGGCSTQKRMYNSKIYEDMSVCHGGQGIIEKSLNFYRVQLNYLEKFEYSTKNDTVYILEMYGIQGEVLVTIWNKNKTLSYTNERGYFETKNEPLFTKYMVKLVSEWNITELKKEEEMNSDMLPRDLIYATKIVFNKGKYHIDCIHFKDFFNPKRDSMDFRD